jgi:hypothetical protein
MKRFFILLPLMTFCSIVFSQNETIYAEVNGNTATIWQTGTERNCGALYEMLITLDDFHLQWLQRDTGDLVFCMCNFDLSVTVGPLISGMYYVDVSHTEVDNPDTIYDGSTAFVVEESDFRDSVAIISYYQSECQGGVGSGERQDERAVGIGQNYPNPFTDITFIPYCCRGNDECMLLIFDVFGNVVKTFDLVKECARLRWDGRDNKGTSLHSGIYYYNLDKSPGNDFRRMILIK